MTETRLGRKHTLRLFVILAVMLFCFAGTAYAEENYPQDIRPVPTEDLTGKLVILHSNDVHGEIGSYAKIAALRKVYEELGAEVILADAGDFCQGSLYVNTSLGEDAFTMMNAAGYTVATLGNHEFDFGYEQLKKNLEKAEFHVICANICENGAPIVEPHYLYEAKSGCKVGFFGLDTEEAKIKANPKRTIGLTFYGGSDMYRIAEDQVQDLRGEGADLVIALTHLGVSNESASNGNRSTDLAKNTAGINVIIDGHSHTVMTSGGEDALIQSTGTKFKYIGILVVGEDGTLEDHYLVDAEQVAADEAPAVEAAAKEIMARVDEEYSVKIAVNEVEFEADRSINRKRETNSGNLITDAMRWYFAQDPEVLEVPVDHLVAIANGGGIREGLPIGDVTKKDVNTVFPFSNTLEVEYVTGEELLEALEASTFYTPLSFGGFPQTAGISMTIDTTREFDAGELYPGSTYYEPASIQRVTIDSINGKPFDPEETYAVAMTDFMASGGDTYFVFSMKEGFDTGVLLDELLISYIQEGMDGLLTEEKYGKIRGEQKIILAEDGADGAAAAGDAGASVGEDGAEADSEGEGSVDGAGDAGVEAEPDGAAAGGTYTVERGDCLWRIAEKIYGDGSKWTLIYENNRDIIKRPNLILPGQILKLPDAA